MKKAIFRLLCAALTWLALGGCGAEAAREPVSVSVPAVTLPSAQTTSGAEDVGGTVSMVAGRTEAVSVGATQASAAPTTLTLPAAWQVPARTAPGGAAQTAAKIPVPAQSAASPSPQTANPARYAAVTVPQSGTTRLIYTKKSAAVTTTVRPAATTAAAGIPAPEPPATTTAVAAKSVTLSIECKTAVANGNETALASYPDGSILAARQFAFTEEVPSVYNLLDRSGVAIETTRSAMGVYVRSIGGLAAGSSGGMSGWIYLVNGAQPSMSCDKYVLKSGDVVAWRFTCNGGRDL
ncbi:MAG: DUF4430 domain-containing protein [Oscillospiraceae bacterium]|jgi:hypothetical protein|nr:DUF4430 domain-containing protein [Oscillospiraceae bacterium]